MKLELTRLNLGACLWSLLLGDAESYTMYGSTRVDSNVLRISHPHQPVIKPLRRICAR